MLGGQEGEAVVGGGWEGKGDKMESPGRGRGEEGGSVEKGLEKEIEEGR